MATRALGIADIRKLLAHRPPMFFLERAIYYGEEQRLIAYSTHYPANRMRQLESLGQAAALLIRQTPQYAKFELPVFASMRNVRWVDGPSDANTVEYHVELKRKRARFGFVDAIALADGKVELCSARLNISISMAFVVYPVLSPSNAHSSRNRCINRRSARATQRIVTRCCIPTTSSNTTTTALTERLRNEISQLVGDERGLFTSSDTVREELEKHIIALESTSKSFDRVTAAAGTWRLLYTTLTILGRRRVRLAIATGKKSGFVRITDITQSVEDGVSVNTVNFKLLTGGVGKFEVRARYEVINDMRVDVKLDEWTLEPEKMREILGENINLLLQIFNPEGWLDITYVDDNLRIGRDHSANIFVLERVV